MDPRNKHAPRQLNEPLDPLDLFPSEEGVRPRSGELEFAHEQPHSEPNTRPELNGGARYVEAGREVAAPADDHWPESTDSSAAALFVTATGATRSSSGVVAAVLIGTAVGAFVVGAYLYERSGTFTAGNESSAREHQQDATRSPTRDEAAAQESEAAARSRRAATDTDVDRLTANSTGARGTLSRSTAAPPPPEQPQASPSGVGATATPASPDTEITRPTESPAPPRAAAARERAPVEPRPEVSAPAATAVPPSGNLTGDWTLSTFVEASSLRRFEGMRLGYDIRLYQYGALITGGGFKVAENGRPIRPEGRTPITVRGTIQGDRLTLTFTERGATRQSSGTFVMFSEGEEVLRGRFSTDAARSSGRVEARRQ